MPNSPESRAVRHQAYELAFSLWFSALPAEDQAALRKAGQDKPLARQSGSVRHDQSQKSAPESGAWDHPADHIEPSDQGEKELVRAFSEALLWCCSGNSIVEAGRRFRVLLFVWKPALLAGLTLEIEKELLEEFRQKIDRGGVGGGGYGPVLAWAREGTRTLSKLGQRVLAIAYVLNPAAINGATLAEIGKITNHTRQAVDKLVMNFRDTFGGLQSRSMRSEHNRTICRAAQLRSIAQKRAQPLTEAA